VVPPVIRNGASIKWMPVHYANAHFIFALLPEQGSATLQIKNAPDKVGDIQLIGGEKGTTFEPF
jgi:hypothetical protein